MQADVICAHRQVENQRKPLSVCFPKLSPKWTFRNIFVLHEAFPSEMCRTNWMKQIKGILESRKISISGAISTKPGCFFEVGETWGNLSNFFLLSSPKTHPPSHSQLQLVTPIMTRRKTRRKKTSPETTYTIAEVIEIDTDDSISAILHQTSLAKLRLLFRFFSLCERLKISATALKI